MALNVDFYSKVPGLARVTDDFIPVITEQDLSTPFNEVFNSTFPI